METLNSTFSANENLLDLRPKSIPKNAFSYTNTSNVTNKPKPPLFPKPKDMQRVNIYETAENETVNLDENTYSGKKFDSKPINIETSCFNFNPQISVNNNDSSKKKMHLLEDYIKLENTETVPPPLPSRPPPVFKYPLGTFYKETQQLNTERQKQTKCLQNKTRLSGELAKININDDIGEIATPSAIQENKSFHMLDLELKVKQNNVISQEKNLIDVQKNLINASVETEKSQNLITLSVAELEANKNTRDSNSPCVFQKRSISIPFGHQEMKPSQPLPQPELHIKMVKKKSSASENIPSLFLKKSSKIPLEINESQTHVSVLDVETNTRFMPKPKNINLQSTELKRRKIKPNKSSSFHQRAEQILVEQRTHEQECLNPVSRLKQEFEVRLAEFSENDWMDMNQSTIQENISLPKEMNLEKSNDFNSDQSFKAKTENSFNFKFENVRMATSSTELRDEQNNVNLNEDHMADFSVLHSLNRPTLPQKMKSTQRSLSYTSLVQTVRDIRTSIWNPSDKSKRISTVITSNVTDMEIRKDEHSASDSKTSEIQKSSKEEKNVILRSIWFHDINATEAQHRLLKLDQDGAFLIRPTSRPTDIIQYTASITYAGRVFNIHIRRKANDYFALGKEKDGEKSFQSLSDLIKYHQDVPFDIHPAGSSDPHAICFRVTPPH